MTTQTPASASSSASRAWPRATLAERFWPKVRKTATCWLWIASRDGRGYGQINAGGRRGKPIAAHRVSYELEYGPVPEGLVVDHLCGNTLCVNPSHLEAVPFAENIRRSVPAERMRPVSERAIDVLVERALMTLDEARYVVQLLDEAGFHIIQERTGGDTTP